MSTLADVANRLEETNQTQEVTKDAILEIRDQFADHFEHLRNQAGDELEARKKAERRGAQSNVPSGLFGQFKEMSAEVGDVMKGTFLGGTLLGIGSRLLGIIKAPLAALKFLWKYKGLFASAGLIFTGIYQVFKDIGDNPTFQASIEGIKETWGSIKERFDDIYNSLSAMVRNVWNDEGTQVAMGDLIGWFNNLRKQIQDFVSENLSIVFDTIDGVLEGIQLLIDGEWKAGLSKIGTTLFNGIVNSFDSLITNFLQIFGINFGEDGTFLSWLGEQYDYMMAKMIMNFREFKQKINDGFEAVVNFFVGEDGYVQTTYNGIKTWIGLKWSQFKTTITDGWTNLIDFLVDPEKEGSIPYRLNQVKVAIQNKATEIYDNIVNKVNDLVEAVMSFIPSAEDIKASLISAVQALPGGEKLLNLLGVETPTLPETMEDRISANNQQFESDRAPAHENTKVGGGTWYGHQRNPSYFADQMEELLANDPNYRGPTGTAPSINQTNNTTSIQNNNAFIDPDVAVSDHFDRQYIGIRGFGASPGMVF